MNSNNELANAKDLVWRIRRHAERNVEELSAAIDFDKRNQDQASYAENVGAYNAYQSILFILTGQPQHMLNAKLNEHRMKDNFDLKGYLVENKMTENSRGDVRHHLTEAVSLDMRLFKGKKLLNEGSYTMDHHDPEYDPDYLSGPGADQVDAALDAQEDASLDAPLDRRTFLNLCREKGYEIDDPRRAVLWATMRDRVDGPDREALDAKFGVNDANVDQWLSRQSELDECGDIDLDEAGYTDDSEKAFVPDVPVDREQSSSLLDIINRKPNIREDEDDDDFGDEIPFDPRAEKIAARDMKADDPNHDADIDTDFSSDAGEEAPEEDVPISKHNKWVTGDLSMDSLFGTNAPNVEIFGDSDDDNKNLQQLFRKHKNYRPNLLKGAVEQAMQYFRDFEKPDSLYLIPAIDRGGYEMKRFNPGHRAIGMVYRPEELSGERWANQI